jgi:SAM-dependent methyltransferase
MPQLFDYRLRAMRRDRAARIGTELFLLDRAFADCLERIALVQRSFERALLIGCPDPAWPEQLRPTGANVEVYDPGPLFAERARGSVIVEDQWRPEGSFDLVVAVGTLDTVDGLPQALRLIASATRPDSLFIGAISGGDTLPLLRGAMRAADQLEGEAQPHVHPRIEASALCPLLAAAGFAMPVADVDRVQVSYPSLTRLVSDLRAMGATNILNARPRKSLTRAALAAAEEAFMAGAAGGRAVETFEILHFAAWTPALRQEEG